MLVRKSIAAALMTVAIAFPAVAAETGAWPELQASADAWPQIAQVNPDDENAPPFKPRRKPGQGGAPAAEGGEKGGPSGEPSQKKVRKSDQQAPAAAPERKKEQKEKGSPPERSAKPGTGSGAPEGQAPPKKVRKPDQKTPAQDATRKDATPEQKKVRKSQPQQPPRAAPDVETRQAEPLRRKPGNGPDAVVKPGAPRDGGPRVIRRAGPKGPGPTVVIGTPSSDQILRRLEAPVRVAPPRNERVTIREFKRRPELRRAAPSIDIQSINFAFGSAEIPVSQYRKVEIIADALDQLLRRRPESRILIEGHTDAVGSDYSNQALSEQRAASLKRTLVRDFGLPPYALETVGYGEDFLLVPTQAEEWQNRRVTLRRIDDFIE